MKKISVLWLRQLRKYKRSRSRLLGSLFEPIVFLLVLGYGLGAVFARAGMGDYFEFLAPGVIGQVIIFNAMFSGTEIIWDRQFGLLRETLVAPISRFNIMFGRTLGSATVAAIQGTLVMLLAFALGFRPASWWGAVPAIGVMVLVALLLTALGTTIASALKDPQGFQGIMNFLVLPMFLLSGALFPVVDASGALGLLVRIDPLTYGVDALRAVLSDAGSYSLGTSLAVLGSTTILLMWLGGQVFKRVEA